MEKITVEVTPETKVHAMHNYSSAHIWLECDHWYGFKSKAVREGTPWDTTSAAADEGTRKHKLLEQVLTTAIEEENFVTIEGEEAVTRAAQGILELLNQHLDCEVSFELAVPLPHEPDSDGHIDVAFWSSELLGIVDAKFGRMEVDPSSPQLKGYAYAVLCRLAALWGRDKIPPRVLLGIAQPEIRSGVLCIEYTTDEIIAFGREVEATVERQIAGRDLHGPEDISACHWCPAKKRCGYRTSIMAGLLDDVSRLPAYTDRALGAALLEEPSLVERVVRSRKAIEGFVEECVAIVVQNPDTFPDWKRTQVGNARKFDLELREADEIAALLEQAGCEFPWTLASPAELKRRYPEQADAIEELTIDQGFHVRLSPLGSVAKRRKQDKPQAPSFADAVEQAMRPAAQPEEVPARPKTTREKAIEEIESQKTKKPRSKKTKKASD